MKRAAAQAVMATMRAKGVAQLMAFVLAPLLTAGLANVAQASGSGKAATGPQYVALAPSFVTNVGGSGAAGFVKADLAVRVEGGEAVARVQHHLPQLRHHLVMLLSRQSQESLASGDGKEQLRQQALAAVRDVLEKEEGKPLVEDLLFTSLIVQR